jgi:hypothetical protein
MLFGIAFCTSASGLLSSETIFWGEQCTTGVLLAPTEGEGSGRVVADIAKLSVGREAYYTRELATDDEQYLSGHGESPARWYGACRYQPWAGGRSIAGGFRQMFEGRRPDSGEPLGRPHGRNAVPAFAWCRGRPRATRSCTAWAARPPAVRCSGRIIHDLPDHRADVTSQG